MVIVGEDMELMKNFTEPHSSAKLHFNLILANRHIIHFNADLQLHMARWPRELNALQIEKHLQMPNNQIKKRTANKKKHTCKLRKQLRQFD